jgi:hypothetical protein
MDVKDDGHEHNDSKKLCPVMKPEHNLREIAKELRLLERHLSTPCERCPDCIRKHFLTAEALAEEAIGLDVDKRIKGLEALAPWLRRVQVQCESGEDKCDIAQQLRQLRKSLVTQCYSATNEAAALQRTGITSLKLPLVKWSPKNKKLAAVGVATGGTVAALGVCWLVSKRPIKYSLVLGAAGGLYYLTKKKK